MRSLIVLLIVLLLSTSACQKGIAPKTNIPFSLQATWKLIKYSGGIAGGTYIPTPDQQQTLIFRVDSSLCIITPNQITNTTYSLQTDSTINSPAIYFGNGMLPLVMTHNRDTLTLTSFTISDGYTFTYIRQ